MKIQQVSVNGLFGIFDHVIPLNTHERITIIHGPNGFGKTAMLRMLNGLFNSQYSVFRSIPFTKFQVEFDDNSNIQVVKTSETSKKSGRKDPIELKFHKPNSEPASFSIKQSKHPPDGDFPIGILDDLIPELRRVGSKHWRYLPTGETLSLSEVIDRFEDVLPLKGRLRDEPEWLTLLKSDIHIHLIESQRLLNVVGNHSSKYSATPSILPTVSAYSKQIAELIQSKLAEYGTTSQSLDRTFPARVVQQRLSSDVSDESLRNQLNELEETRSRLVEVGLLGKDENSDFQIQPQSIDESTKSILSVYIEDVEKKLSVFDEIASKIDLLSRIVNSKFAYSYKKMNFSRVCK
jgi:energy-coupling factor transporter ATP-binding protein EcfA2